MSRSEELTAFGPGKVILLGEHGVVYGHPALAGPLSLGVTAVGAPSRKPKLEVPDTLGAPARKLLKEAFRAASEEAGFPGVSVRLKSDLPTSMGLGSSAAVSVACARLLLRAAGDEKLRHPDVLRVAWAMEKVFHGTPSGVDHTTSALASTLSFRRKVGAEKATVRRIESPRPVKLLVALLGQRPPTKSTVAGLRARQAKWPKRYSRLFDEIGRVSEEGVRAVESGDLELLGDLMNVNQGLLSALGLSSAGIEGMVHRLRGLGALGAKLTGAGGDGGAVIGLFEDPAPVVARLKREGIRCFSSQIAGPEAK